MGKKKWCEKSVATEALKYNTRNEFKDNSSGAYGYALKYKILDSVSKHMVIMGNKYNRFIYKIIFPKINSIYIGLTYNFNERKNSHIKNSSNKNVKYLMSINEEHFWFCDKDITPENKVGIIEKTLIEDYKNNGWNVLNISSGGGLGGGYKWTKELVENEAKNYNNRGDFRIKSSGAYHFAQRHRILDDICKHMKSKWSLEVVKNVASNFSSRAEFARESCGAYHYALRNKILDEVCEHMN